MSPENFFSCIDVWTMSMCCLLCQKNAGNYRAYRYYDSVGFGTAEGPTDVALSVCRSENQCCKGAITSKNKTCTKTYKKAVLSQRWPHNAPYRSTWVPWKFSGIPDYAHSSIPNIFYGLLFGSTLWMFLQNLKSVALPVLEIIGGTQKNLGTTQIRPRSLFSEIFNKLLFKLSL